MAFFDNLSKKVQNAATVAGEKTKDIAFAAGEKSKDIAESVKVSTAIASEQRAMEKQNRALGEWVANEMADQLPEAVADILAAIKASREKIAELEASRAKEEAPAEEAVVGVVCPACGAVSTGKFCPACGAALQ